MALHPDFPNTPYVYVLYAHDADIGGTAPKWSTPGATSDPCPTPPGPTADGCVISARLSRLTANGNVAQGGETVLVENWFQQYPSHSIGSLVFGADGMLYASGGDGASYNFADWGQDGNPLNPGGDPPGGVGGVQTPPTAEGGALRVAGSSNGRRSRHARRNRDSHRPPDGAGTNRQPALHAPRWPTANVSSLTGCGILSESRAAREPTKSGSETSAGARGRRSTASSIRPMRSSTTSRGHATRAPAVSRATTAPTSTSASNSTRPVPVTPPHFAYRHQQKVSTEACATGSSVDLGPCLLRQRHVPEHLSQRAVLL